MNISKALWVHEIKIFTAWVCGLALTLISISSAALTAWRLAADPGWTRPFFIEDGLLSRYPAWIVITITTEFAAFSLRRWVAKQLPAAQVAAASDIAPCGLAASEATAAAV
jgi:hypothetical protein